MRRSLSAALLTCACLFAQGQATDVFQKAPPDVDQALRARVSQYFQAHVDGKYRQAEQVVSPECRDMFYEMEKQRYISFEIVKIDYSDNFTKAKVVTAVEVDWRSPRLGVIRVKPPMTSAWRIEDGQWYWYTLPKKDWETPWGIMHPGPDKKDGSAVAATFRGVSPADVLSQVKINKDKVLLSSYEVSHDIVEVANGLPGEINIHLDTPAMQGLSIKVDKPALKSGETARIQFDYSPPTKTPKNSSVVNVRIDPMGQIIPVHLTFAIPPEVQKQLERSR